MAGAWAAVAEVRISDPALLERLAVDLRERLDVVVEQIDDQTLGAHIVGSYREDAMRIELFMRVRAWEAAQRARGIDVSVEIAE